MPIALFITQRIGARNQQACIQWQRGRNAEEPKARLCRRAAAQLVAARWKSRVVAEALAALADGKPRLVPYTLVDPAQR